MGLCCVLFWSVFFLDLPGFLTGIGSGRSVFQVPFVEWIGIHVWMCDPPSPFYGCVFRSPFCDWGRGFVYLEYFFVGKLIFTYFLSRFCGWVGVFFTVGWLFVYFVWVGAWVLCWCLVSWSIVYDVCCVIGARSYDKRSFTR